MGKRKRTWPVGAQVTVTFQRRPINDEDPDEFPPVRYLGVVTGHHTSSGCYQVRVEGSRTVFSVSSDQVDDSILDIFARIR